MEFEIKDIALADKGALRAKWAGENMPVLGFIRDRLAKEKGLEGMKVVVCLHVTAEMAALAQALKSAGAEVIVCAVNSLTTQDDVAASLVKNDDIQVFAVRNEDGESIKSHINTVIDLVPQVVLDSGAVFTATLHQERTDNLALFVGGTEGSVEGVGKLAQLADSGRLGVPLISINDSSAKQLFDSRYGTGQSVLDGILRATNRMLAGSVFVVAGYGWSGKGIALRAAGMGANVAVVEIDPLKALEAVMDGFRVMPMSEAAKIGDFFCTATGGPEVIKQEHFLLMKEGAVISNAGLGSNELELSSLEAIKLKKVQVRENVEEYMLPNHRSLSVLCRGKAVNLVGAEGHPAAVMDMSFACQLLAVEYLAKNRNLLQNKVYQVPEEVDQNLARLKLNALGHRLDEPSFPQ
ncbi:MAG: adenosylhomocysteinase [bacterium]